ncbi:hypothetical protein Esti_002478 [Eimeria stiedai]
MGGPLDTAAETASAAEEGPLTWWQRLQLPLLAATETSGVVLVLGGADGSAELRFSVLLPLLLLQHNWAAQQQQPQQQQHIVVALETQAGVDSAETAAKAWGGGCYAPVIRSSSSSSRAARPRLLYLTTHQLLQRMLQQPLLPGCSVAAVEVSLQHGFGTELLLPLLQRVKTKRPYLRLLLLLPPAAIEPHWALHLARFFAADTPGSREAAVTPQGVLDTLAAAARQRQQHLLRLLTPSKGRWDLRAQQQRQRQQQQQQQQQVKQQVKRQRSSSALNGEEEGAAAPAVAAGVPSDIEILSSSSSSRKSSSRRRRKGSSSSSSVSCVSADEVILLKVSEGAGGPAIKRKKNKEKEKRKITKRLRKIQRKLRKLNNNSNSSSSNSSSSSRGTNVSPRGAPWVLTHDSEEGVELLLASPRRFLEEHSHGTGAPLVSSGDEAAATPTKCAAAARSFSPTARKAGPPAASPAAGVGSPKGAPKGPSEEVPALGERPQKGPSKGPPEGPSEGPPRGPLWRPLEGPPRSVCVVGASPLTHRVSVRYLKRPTPNFVRAAASVVASVVASAAVSPGGLFSFGSIFVFLPSADEVSSLAQALQQRLQQLPQRLQQQQQEQKQQDPPVEIVCLSPDPSPRLPKASSSLSVFLSSSPLPPCVSESELSVAVVVDCMYTRRSVFDRFLSLSRACNVPISRALADMRASLAGRGSRTSGCCYRLCTAAAFAAAAAPAAAAAAVPGVDWEAALSPAALEDIAPLLLKLKALGVHTLQHLPLLHPPPPAVVAAAAKKLLQLQAVDESGRLTRPMGLLMAQGLLSPELTRLLAFACSLEASTVCALLSGPPIWHRPALQALGGPRGGLQGAPLQGSSQAAAVARQRLSLCRALLGVVEGDPLTALNAFTQYFAIKEEDGHAAAAAWADKHLLEEATLRRAAKKRETLLRWMDACGLPRRSCNGDCVPLLRALTAAFCLNLAQHTGGKTYRLFTLPKTASAPPFVIHPLSVLANCQPPFVVFAHAFWRDGCVYMQQVTTVEPGKAASLTN